MLTKSYSRCYVALSEIIEAARFASVLGDLVVQSGTWSLSDKMETERKLD
jgi:hypothetical protein